MSYNTAFDTVKRARKFIKPNKGFVEFLKKYEITLNNQCTLTSVKGLKS